MNPPEGFYEDPANPGWWFNGGDPNNPTSWWQSPPEGYVTDPNSEGWYYNPAGDPNDPSTWWHDGSLQKADPSEVAASPLTNLWTPSEIAVAAQIPPPWGPNVELIWPLLAPALTRYGADSVLSAIGAIGTIAHEAASRFYPIHEFGSDFSRYGYAPNGQDYGGRGLIQTTWASNYGKVQTHTGIPCVENPDLLLDPANSVEAFCVYWTDPDHGPVVNYAKAGDWYHVRYYVYGAGDPVGQARIQRVANYLLPLAQERGAA